MTCLNLVPESILQEPKVIKNACMALASIVEARGKRTTVSFFFSFCQLLWNVLLNMR